MLFPRCCVLLICLIPAGRLAMAASPPSTAPASRPATPSPVDQVIGQMVTRANLVLTEPLAPGATAAQAKVVLAERADRVQRLAEPLIGQRVIVNTPVADVVETAKDKSLPQGTKLAAR
jgi:hypothetical protein